MQQPAHEWLPEVAMANSLGNVAAGAFISGLSLLVGSVVPKVLGKRALSWLLDPLGDLASTLLVIPGYRVTVENICRLSLHNLRK